MRVLYDVNQQGISMLIPCYNEEPIISHTIKGLMNLDYDNFEVIFINDGSEDSTFTLLYDLLDLAIIENYALSLLSNEVKGIYQSNKYPFIYVIDKYNGGKADSLNVGTLCSKKELILTMDADCVLEKNALLSMNKVFDDKDVIASGGVIHIMQMFKLDNKLKKIVLMQALDYIKGFYIYKSSLAYNNALSIISGAFGIFKKSIIFEVGGFKTGLGEDIDITLKFQEYGKKHNKKLVFNKNAICYTECPENLKELSKQRIRWQKGFIDAILNNSSFLFKNIFKSNVCFYMIIDALLSNSFATIVFIINVILILAKIIYNYPLYLFIYYVNTILFNIFSSIIAIRSAKKNIPNLKTKILYSMIIFDMIFFQFLRIFFFIIGTVTYYFDNKNWNKVSRTNNSYKL
ncbi:glycosyltransferase family 2 protein [Clostridium sp. D2Q-11]|uniref:Glycosyltransferase family 2 protein n=1 Tax=Anaeromonas frigoriresistens TaxID=2683708 RepID=A0A942V3Q6_9FIRM|nr:glycosyltransferase family 2 protein [Anaeromonas frigoriresistens]MBS4539372.1 glycosyltransferase family 2 protein [Anaeromonas frigoriresistens]